MQPRSTPSLIAALAAIGLNLTPGLARADFDRVMSGPPPVESRVLAAEIGAFRDGAQSFRALPTQINDRVDQVQHRSGALVADLSAHVGRIEASRSEGVIMAMSDPTEMVVARLDGMLIAYELIDAQVRLSPGAAPEPIRAGSLPNPTVLRMLVDERMGMPSGEASLAGYERMMTSWSDLGASPSPAPIRDPETEARVMEILEKHPEMGRFVSADLIRSPSEERAERIRMLVSENPGMERFVHSSILKGGELSQDPTGSPEVQMTEERRAQIRVKMKLTGMRIDALAGEGPARDPFSAPEKSGPDLNR